MLVNICMKFHEDFEVIDMICHRTVNDKLQSDITKKIHIQELWFLHSACHLLVPNICMKFYEYILNSFKVIERTQLCQEIASLKVQSDVTQKMPIQELGFALRTSPNVG